MARKPVQRTPSPKGRSAPREARGEGTDSRRHTLLAGGALVVLVLASYAWALKADFIWDDDAYVTKNMTLAPSMACGGCGSCRFPFSIIRWSTRRFGSNITCGARSAGYHAVNVLLHAPARSCVRLLVRLKMPGAWLAAALFAVHPVHVESVAWITERKNVLSLPLVLASMLAYLRFAPLKEPLDASTAAHAAGRWRWYAASLLLFIAAAVEQNGRCDGCRPCCW